MTGKEKPIDAKALMSAIANGWKLVDTPKVRAGFKEGQQKLVQTNGKTLGMLTLREAKGVRVEGSRLDRNITVTEQLLHASTLPPRWNCVKFDLPQAASFLQDRAGLDKRRTGPSIVLA